MKKYLLLLSIVFQMTLLSCKEDTEVPQTIIFDGITDTDVNGQPTGIADPKDWNLNEEWTREIQDLFGSEAKLLCADFDTYEAHAVRPNPTPGPIVWSIEINDTINASQILDVEIRIVDREMQLLKNFSFQTTEGFRYNEGSFDLSDINVKNDTVRMFYKLIAEDCELRGYGDIVILE